MRLLLYICTGLAAIATFKSSDYFYLIFSLVVFLTAFVVHKSKYKSIKVITLLYFLGYWLKITIHKIIDYDFVEPNGAFSGQHNEWIIYYTYASIISLSIALSSSIANLLSRRRISEKRIKPSTSLPKHLTFKKIFLIAFIIFINAANYKWQFFVIGLASAIVLPFYLNAIMAFLIFIGAPILVCIVGYQDLISSGRITKTMIFIFFLIGILTSITSYSRAFLFILITPIFLGLTKNKNKLITKFKKPRVNWLGIVYGVTAIMSLVSVSIMRIYVFGGKDYKDTESLKIYFYETIGLFADRWIGAEALMVAVTSNQSLETFGSLIVDKGSGVFGVYQSLAETRYLFSDNFTFLTHPGYFAILAFSGSLTLILLGVLAMSFLAVTVEITTSKLFPNNSALLYFVITIYAYQFSMVVYPYLLVPFLIQLVGFLWICNFLVKSTDDFEEKL